MIKNNEIYHGGKTNYGQIVGILMSDSVIPRVPGDPGHAETFPFPVRYGVLSGFPFSDLVEIRKDNIDIIIKTSKALENEGVHFIAADCGLFAPFQVDVSRNLSIPFIGSALDLIPLLSRFLPPSQKIGVITGDVSLIKQEHLESSGADLERTVLSGMETCAEFKRVVIDRGLELNLEVMRKGTVQSAAKLRTQNVGAVILECTNLITFRMEV